MIRFFRVNNGLPATARVAPLRANGLVFGIITGLIFALINAAIMTFLMHKGMPLGERCFCSWSKVIIFSVAVFILIAVFEFIGFAIYLRKSAQMAMVNNPQMKARWNNGGRFRWFLGTLLCFTLVPLLIIFFLVTFFVDQNNNWLWFFHTDAGVNLMGVLCVVCALIGSVLTGVLTRLGYSV